MSDLIKREDVLNVLRAFGWTPIDGLYLVVKQDIPSADRPQDDCSTCEHYNDVGDWCKTCGVSHYTPRMKGADDETHY